MWTQKAEEKERKVENKNFFLSLDDSLEKTQKPNVKKKAAELGRPFCNLG